MIGFLRGSILYKKAPFLMLDVNGVGYELEAPMSTFYALPEKGQDTALFTHLVVRDDAHILFAFATEIERLLFRTLLKVNGVGAKMGLAILSGMSVEEFSACIANGDTAGLVKLPGVGKKTAERLIIEMRDRLDKLEGISSPSPTQSSMPDSLECSPSQDAESALIALGYKATDANRMVKAVATVEMTDSEAIIKAALQALTKRK